VATPGQRRPTRSSSVLTQKADDTLVLLSVDKGTYFSLNEVGAEVWSLCDGNRTVDEVVDVIYAQFDAPRDVVERDVLLVVKELASEHLLVDPR
jgi:hypothetical protein